MPDVAATKIVEQFLNKWPKLIGIDLQS